MTRLIVVVALVAGVWWLLRRRAVAAAATPTPTAKGNVAEGDGFTINGTEVAD